MIVVYGRSIVVDLRFKVVCVKIFHYRFLSSSFTLPMSDKNNKTELLFQVLLHVVVFLFYAFEREELKISPYKIYYFLTYAGIAAIINYFLMPRFLYRRKYVQFAVGLTLLLGSVIAFEELVQEQIFFPTERAIVKLSLELEKY